MGYRKEREEFIARVTKEGLPYRVAELLLREATGLNRRAELACSSEDADRDRVPCPAIKGGPCLCGSPEAHDKDTPELSKVKNDPKGVPSVPRIAVKDWHAERRIEAALPIGWRMQTQGDPRGYVLRVIPPSYAERNAGKDQFNLDTIGVPSGPAGLRF